jgi:hypothetical protein
MSDAEVALLGECFSPLLEQLEAEQLNYEETVCVPRFRALWSGNGDGSISSDADVNDSNDSKDDNDDNHGRSVDGGGSGSGSGGGGGDARALEPWSSIGQPSYYADRPYTSIRAEDEGSDRSWPDFYSRPLRTVHAALPAGLPDEETWVRTWSHAATAAL